MPGYSYDKIGTLKAESLAEVQECKINSSTKQISESLNLTKLAVSEELVSFNVTSLYTNVPVNESIQVCADLLYSGKYKLPSVEKDTFIELAKMASCNVIMSTHHVYYKS